MSFPIEPTPILEGEDAKRLLRDIRERPFLEERRKLFEEAAKVAKEFRRGK